MLKAHLVQGYSLKQRGLQERGVECEQAMDLLSCTLTQQNLVTDEGAAVAGVIRE